MSDHMLNLNLLPPQEKEKLVYIWRARSLVVIASGFIMVFVISLVLLLPTFFTLFFQKNEALRAVALEKEAQERTGLKERVEAVEQAGRLGGMVLEHESRRGLSFGLIESLLKNIPSNVRLESIKLQNQTREVTIVGFAPARQDLLELLKNLEENPRIAKVSSPVANLIREVDIHFSILINLRP